MMDERPGRGFDVMSPELAREARKALSLSHKQLGQEIGEPAATVMKYELGRPVDEAVIEKLRGYFKRSQVQVLRNGSVRRYQVSMARSEDH